MLICRIAEKGHLLGKPFSFNLNTGASSEMQKSGEFPL